MRDHSIIPTKTCTKCGNTLPLSSFGRHARRRDGLDTQCKRCKKQANLQWLRTTEKGRASKRRRDVVTISRRRQRMKELVDQYKQDSGCAICGETEPVCLDLHHTEAADKVASVSRIVNEMKSWPRLHEELGKCVVLCSNCHRKLHAGKAELPHVVV